MIKIRYEKYWLWRERFLWETFLLKRIRCEVKMSFVEKDICCEKDLLWGEKRFWYEDRLL